MLTPPAQYRVRFICFIFFSTFTDCFQFFSFIIQFSNYVKHLHASKVNVTKQNILNEASFRLCSLHSSSSLLQSSHLSKCMVYAFVVFVQANSVNDNLIHDSVLFFFPIFLCSPDRPGQSLHSHKGIWGVSSFLFRAVQCSIPSMFDGVSSQFPTEGHLDCF